MRTPTTPRQGRGGGNHGLPSGDGDRDFTTTTLTLGDRLILRGASICIEHGIWCRSFSRVLDRIVEYRVRQR